MTDDDSAFRDAVRANPAAREYSAEDEQLWRDLRPDRTTPLTDEDQQILDEATSVTPQKTPLSVEDQALWDLSHGINN